MIRLWIWPGRAAPRMRHGGREVVLPGASPKPKGSQTNPDRESQRDQQSGVEEEEGEREGEEVEEDEEKKKERRENIRRRRQEAEVGQ